MISCLLICFLKGSVFEYTMHRYFMHRRGTYWYQSHHIEHHGYNANETHHMGLSLISLFQVWLLVLPIALLLSWILNPYYIVVWTVFQIWWFVSWEYIHRSIHEESGYQWARFLLPWYSFAKKHHLSHHLKTTTNFGAVFPWTDYIFRTTYGANKLRRI